MGFSQVRLREARQVLRHSRSTSHGNRAYPEPDKPGRGKKGKAAETAGFSRTKPVEGKKEKPENLLDLAKIDSAKPGKCCDIRRN
jgi:hypothetical protein